MIRKKYCCSIFNALWLSIVLIITQSGGLIAQTAPVHIDSTGLEGEHFWLGYLQNSTQPNLRILVSSRFDNEVTISIPANVGFTPISFLMTANTSNYINIPIGFAHPTTGETPLDMGIEISADTLVYVTAINGQMGNVEATPVFPSGRLAHFSEYYVASQPGLSGATPSEFVVVATDDATEVYITLPTGVSTSTGGTGQLPMVTLQRGQLYLVKANGTDNLAGTRIESCKPLAVFSGADRANILQSQATCATAGQANHLYTQISSAFGWARFFMASPFAHTDTHVIQVLAADDNTTVDITGVPTITLNKGEQTTQMVTGAVCISANRGVMAVQYMLGKDCNGSTPARSNPAMHLLTVPNRNIRYALYGTHSTNNITNAFMTVISNVPDVASIRLRIDGVDVPPASFIKSGMMGCAGNQAYAIFPIIISPTQSHVIQSDSSFICSIHAFGNNVGQDESLFYSISGNMGDTRVGIAASNPRCVNEDIFFSASGGRNVINYQWTFAGGTPNAQNGATLTNPLPVRYPSPGNYTVNLTATIDLGRTTCTETPSGRFEVTLVNPSLPNPIRLCGENPVIIDAGAGYDTYAWSTGATTRTISVSVAGNYSVTVSRNGCFRSASTQVVGQLNTSSLQVVPNPRCTNAPVTFSIINPSAIVTNYAWDFGNGVTASGATLTNPPPVSYTTGGNYTVVVAMTEFVNGTFCTTTTKTQIVTINDVNIPLPATATICGATPITLDAGTGFDSYAWNTGATTQTISVSTAGNYTVTISRNGCTNNRTVTVNGQINQTTIQASSPRCNISPVTIQANNTNAFITNYSWDFGNGQTASGASLVNPPPVLYATAGNYIITLITTQTVGAVTCNTTTTLPITITDINFSIPTTREICGRDPITLDAGAGYDTYIWSTGATTQTISVSTAGNYTITVTRGSCSNSQTINVVGQVNTSEIAFNPTPQCNNAPVNFSVTNPSPNATNYAWDFGNGQTATGATLTNPPPVLYATAGNYTITLTITDRAGTIGSSCTIVRTASITVTDVTIPTPNKLFICNVPSVTIDAGAGFDSYVWSTGATTQTISVSNAGNYTVTVSKNGCFNSKTIEVAGNPSTLQILVNKTPACVKEGLRFSIGGNAGGNVIGYLWDFGNGQTQTVANPSPIIYANPGVYPVSLTITTDLGGFICNTSVNRLVEVIKLGLDTLQTTQWICANGVTTLSAGAGYETYLWSTGETTPNITVSRVGSYSITVTKNGCTDSKTIQVVGGITNFLRINIVSEPTQAIQQTFGLSKVAYICTQNRESIILVADTSRIAPDRVEWSNGGFGNRLIVTEAGDYQATVYKRGCVARDVFQIRDACTNEVFIPDAFTPNGDNFNDKFQLSGDGFINLSLRIYNRWGELIFASDNLDNAWDGTAGGKPAPVGAYPWVLIYENRENPGVKIEKRGKVMVIK